MRAAVSTTAFRPARYNHHHVVSVQLLTTSGEGTCGALEAGTEDGAVPRGTGRGGISDCMQRIGYQAAAHPGHHVWHANADRYDGHVDWQRQALLWRRYSAFSGRRAQHCSHGRHHRRSWAAGRPTHTACPRTSRLPRPVPLFTHPPGRQVHSEFTARRFPDGADRGGQDEQGDTGQHVPMTRRTNADLRARISAYRALDVLASGCVTVAVNERNATRQLTDARSRSRSRL